MFVNLFWEMAAVSLSLSVVILVTAGFLKAVGKRCKACTRYLVWTLLFLRLCIPVGNDWLPAFVQIELPFWRETVVDTVLPAGDSIVSPVQPEMDTDFLPDTNPVETMAVNVVTEEQNREGVLTVPEQTGDRAMSEETTAGMVYGITETQNGWKWLYAWLPYLWFGGSIFLLVVQIGIYNRQIRSIARSLHRPDGKEMHIYRVVCRTLGIRKAPKLFCSPMAGSPMMYGFFRPMVVLPDVVLERGALCGILTHELIHYKRRDVWWKLVTLVARAMHWFNPLVQYAAFHMISEMEMACDELVLAGLNATKRKEYGEVMLDMMKRCHVRQETLTTGFNPGKKAVLARFKNIMDTEKKTRARWLPLLTAVTCLLTGTVTAVTPVQQQDTAEDVWEETEVQCVVEIDDSLNVENGVVTERTGTGGRVDPAEAPERMEKYAVYPVGNVVYTGYEISFDDPAGKFIDWYQADIPQIRGEDQWNGEILGQFWQMYGNSVKDLENNIHPAGTFRYSYKTIKWENTVTLVIERRSLPRVRYEGETEFVTETDWQQVHYDIYHYDTTNRTFLTTDQFLTVYTDGQWNEEKLMDKILDYGFLRYGGNPTYVMESDFRGVIPHRDGNGQFDVCLFHGREQQSDKYSGSLLVRVLDYQSYRTDGSSFTAENGEVRTTIAGERYSPLMYRYTTDTKYSVSVYKQDKYQVLVQAEEEAKKYPGAVWVDKWIGVQERYDLGTFLSGSTPNPTFTFAENRGQVRLAVEIPRGRETETLHMVCGNYRSLQEVMDTYLRGYLAEEKLFRCTDYSGASRFPLVWCADTIETIRQTYESGAVPDKGEALPDGATFPEEMLVRDSWENRRTISKNNWEIIVPLENGYRMHVRFAISWVQRKADIVLKSVSFTEPTA